MFGTYQELLGVRFREEAGSYWHPSVRCYRVEKKDKEGAFEPVSYFYMDLFPREGKYGHAAAFTLIAGYQPETGEYCKPVSAIVANFTAPTKGPKETPSLLEHSEVETLFHEFGHILHQILTTARYATFSGTNVKTDYVEAPSQMLENWVWSSEMLAKFSGHYLDKTKPLPKSECDRLVQAKGLNSGIRYLRQLAFALIDMEFHTSAAADSTAIYRKYMQDIMLIPLPADTLPQAGFGHLMGGYDAGYYGYLWSEVYAQDLFSRFEKEGLLNPATGAAYRECILQPGGEKEPLELLKAFLGREPNEEAFFRSIGI